MLFKPKLPKESVAWSHVKNNWLIRTAGRIVIALNLASLTSIIMMWGKLPPAVPLWYSRPWGTDQLASPLALFILPVGSILVYLINLVLAIFFISEYLVFIQMMFLTSLLVSFLSCIAIMKIVFLIT